MNMSSDATEVDRLIEEGLSLYGQGNLDEALLVWEQALAIDPDNAQANSYVDYVRMNYELLTSDLGDEDAGPFGIAADGEAEYQIEIMIPPVEPQTGPPPLHMDPIDEGWYIGDDGGVRAQSPPPGQSFENLTLELEADEPRGASAPSFDDATHEFESSEPDETPGFASQLTELKKRELGFVKPAGGASRPSLESDELPVPQRKRAPTAEPPELKITLRTPQHADEFETSELGPAGRTIHTPPTQIAALNEIDDDDLIASLPSPRALYQTQDMPLHIVPPHQRAALEAIELDEPIEPPSSIHGAEMRELGANVTFSSTQTMDFGDKPTQEVDRSHVNQVDPLISAPTRELGLRTSGASSGGRSPMEDQPTSTTSKALQAGGFEHDPEGTRGDIILSFDPIDARTAQILDEVDRAAPANEAREEKTRRRISVLIDQAQVWATANELDKAVAAIDLALSEDPNSALAQKLIHRNRDTIMSVFQNFLGNLDRQPALARPLHELGTAPISPRAAFLLSRIDGSVTLDEILDISGMPRLEAYRYLCQLFLRGILR